VFNVIDLSISLIFRRFCRFNERKECPESGISWEDRFWIGTDNSAGLGQLEVMIEDWCPSCNRIEVNEFW
jgi:hypothetical protein